MLRKWDDLPDFMRIDEVRPYWEVLNRKRGQLAIKRAFDVAMATALLIILAIPMIVIAVMIKLDSNGPVFYRQKRVTSYGKIFRIHKFRTMVADADKKGASVTVESDNRITKIGSKIRKLRLDELPQLIDVLNGDMSFVGTRPEVVKYVKRYRSEYLATLLLPAGITSEASIRYRDEDRLLSNASNVDEVYVRQVLSEKMRWNLKSIKKYSFVFEIVTIFHTIWIISGKD